MELHLLLTIAAAFLALFGFIIDLQSLLAGIKRWRTGRGSRPVFFWPPVIYALAALAWDAQWPSRAVAFLIGLGIHAVCVLPGRGPKSR